MKHVFTLEGGEKLSKEEFLRYFEKKVRKTIRIHKLFDKKEKIFVACSGGKDSTVVLYLMNKLKNRNIEVEALHIDQSIGKYSEMNKKNITKFCKQHKIKLHVYSFRDYFKKSHYYIRDALQDKGMNWKSCTVCGVLRRYMINRIVKKLKATKVVTGHNLDDEAQSILMNIFNNSIPMLARLGPKSGIKEFEGFVSRIKPLYMSTEEEVKLFSKLMKFPIQYESCPCREDSYRKSVLDMLDKFDKNHIGTKYGIINSFLEMMPVLKKEFSKGKVQICKNCKEPASKEECQTCKVLKIIQT